MEQGRHAQQGPPNGTIASCQFGSDHQRSNLEEEPRAMRDNHRASPAHSRCEAWDPARGQTSRGCEELPTHHRLALLCLRLPQMQHHPH